MVSAVAGVLMLVRLKNKIPGGMKRSGQIDRRAIWTRRAPLAHNA